MPNTNHPSSGGKFAAMQQRAAAAGGRGDSDDSSDDSDDDDLPVQRPVGGGKSFGKMLSRSGGSGGGGGGGGKNILALQRPADGDDDSDSDSDDDSSDGVGAAPPQYGGKSLAGMQAAHQARRGGGKQLRMTVADSDDSDDDSDADDDAAAMDVDEAPAPPAAAPAPAEDDMEESSEDEDEDNVGDDDVDDDDDDDDDDDVDEEIEELDMETFDTAKLVRDDADRKRLEAMPEFEREAELADRFEKLRNELDMKRALQQDKRRVREEKEHAKKQKAAAAAAAAGKKKGGAKAKAKAKAKGKTTRTSARATSAKTRKQKEQEVADAELAASLSTRESSKPKRNKDASGFKGKKAAALRSLREERNAMAKAQKADGSDSDLDYGDEGASDSESDYEDDGGAVNKPWLQQKQTRKTRLQRDVSSESESDEDAMMDDDDDEAGGGGRGTARGGRPSGASTVFVEADVADYAKVTIPRRRLSRWCHEPFFEEAVTGMYVKLAVGKDSQKLKSCYRLCQIVGVETRPAEYTFPPDKNSNKKPVSTNKVLQLKFGSSIRAFRMALISDSKAQEEDVKALASHLRDSRLNDEILSKKRAIKLRKMQDKLVNTYTYTREDIEKSIAAKKKRKVGNIGAEKTKAAIAVQAAQEDVTDAEAKLDEARRAHLEAGEDDMGIEQLESAVTLATEALEDAKSRLEEQKLEQERILTAEENRKKRIKGADKIQDWNKVNERALERNKMADYEAYKQQQEQEKKEAAGQGAPKFNPYARRKVKPKILWEVGQKADEDDKDKAEAEDAAASTAAAAAAAQASSDGQKGSGTAALGDANANVPGKENAATAADDDRKNNGDFAIDDELLVRGGTDSLAAAAGSGKSAIGRTGVRVRKGLSFAEYQKAKEVGHL